MLTILTRIEGGKLCVSLNWKLDQAALRGCHQTGRVSVFGVSVSQLGHEVIFDGSLNSRSTY